MGLILPMITYDSDETHDKVGEKNQVVNTSSLLTSHYLVTTKYIFIMISC